MCRELMPRVHELMSLIEDPYHPRAYFQGFDGSVRTEPLKRRAWLARESEFNRLEQDAWEFLKAEARPYLTRRDLLRGWSQLIDMLNLVRAHNFLLDSGCQRVRFIPRETVKTPDLEGETGSTKILCEVKTINISDREARRRKVGGVGSSTVQLEAGFFKKLKSDLSSADRQLRCFNSDPRTRRIVFLVIDFDDSVGDYKQSYYEQIDDFLASYPVNNIELVFYNQLTASRPRVELRHATVVNEREH